MDTTQAMEEYLDHLSILEPEWRNKDPDLSGRAKTSWVSVSTMLPPDKDQSSSDKTLLDHVKEGNCAAFKTANVDVDDLQSLDPDSGMAYIHWAADRGHCEMVLSIVSAGCNVDLIDSEGQTALHYAASCGHEALVKALLDANADKNKKDCDGLTPVESASEEVIKLLLL